VTDLAITIRGLKRSYGSLPAVDGVDLDVVRGEIFALLGPNGAGKTTTVEILEGFRHRDAGTVSVLGHDPAKATPAWRARVGIVLQTARDLEELTVVEAVSHFAQLYPAPRDVEEVIEAVGLSASAGTLGRVLSGGQRRRLDVALGIIGDPELIFLDEPTTGFDPEARRQFWDLVSGLRTGGTTVVLTTHYLDEAEHLADRVAVIAAGRVLEVATPATLGGRASFDPVVRWTEGGTAHELATHTPTATVAEISARLGGEVPDLAVVRPTLEDVYLRMIGPHTHRPEAPPPGRARRSRAQAGAGA
jgi:ABC-2 type transport system ATP-binding protein